MQVEEYYNPLTIDKYNGAFEASASPPHGSCSAITVITVIKMPNGETRGRELLLVGISRNRRPKALTRVIRKGVVIIVYCIVMIIKTAIGVMMIIIG